MNEMYSHEKKADLKALQAVGGKEVAEEDEAKNVLSKKKWFNFTLKFYFHPKNLIFVKIEISFLCFFFI